MNSALDNLSGTPAPGLSVRSPQQPSVSRRESRADGGGVLCAVPRRHDADEMRDVLGVALQMVDAGAPMAELRLYADYLESMAFSTPTRWFRPPGCLSSAWREYFELADRLQERFQAASGQPEPDNGMRMLTSAMAVLSSRVLTFVAQDGKDCDQPISLGLITAATGASNRMRRWCGKDEPGLAPMLGVLCYTVIGVASGAVEVIGRDAKASEARADSERHPDRRLAELRSARDLREMVSATGDALDEVLATLKQLAADHSPRACFDDGPGAHLAGEPSRAVRALQGVAWSHDALGQAGFLPEQGQLRALLELLELLWHEAHGRANETHGLVATAAHLTSAWSSLISAGGSDSIEPAVKTLWIARQASATIEHDLAVAHRTLEVAQAAIAVAGAALRRKLPGARGRSPGSNSLHLAMRAAELAAHVVERCHGTISPQALMGTLDNLTRIAADSCELRLGDCTRLLDLLTRITSAAMPRR